MILRKPFPACAAIAVAVAIASSAQAQTGSKLTAKEAQAVVNIHNQVRSQAGVKTKLVWDKNIAAFAQKWADYIASRSEFKHRPRSGVWKQKYGENLSASFPGPKCIEKGMQGWINEKKLYKGEVMDGRNYMKFGHYTQMIWDKTKRVGCGKAYDAKKKWFVIVCNYDPPGNYRGQKPISTKVTTNPPARKSDWRIPGRNSGGPLLVMSNFFTNKSPKINGKPSKTLRGYIDKSRRYTLEMKSSDVTPAFAIYKPDGKLEGYYPSGARITKVVLRPKVSGTYRIVLTTRNKGQTGRYEFSISSP